MLVVVAWLAVWPPGEPLSRPADPDAGLVVPKVLLAVLSLALCAVVGWITRERDAERPLGPGVTRDLRRRRGAPDRLP